MNSVSSQYGLTEELYQEYIENMFDSTNIFVLMELYYRETTKSNSSEFVALLTKYLQKHGMINK